MADIILLSGGIDSTSVLYDLAQNTPRVIHAVHVYLPALRKGDIERAAARKIAVWLARNVRPVKYVEMAYEGPTCGSAGFNVFGALVGAHIVDSFGRHTVVQGTNGDQDQTPDSLARNARFEAVLRAMVEGMAPMPEVVRPHETIPKIENYRAMPEELRALTVSCVEPIGTADDWKPCGRCPRCEIRRELEESL